MQTAYLILAHRQPQHVARLTRLLCAGGASAFVHVDKKVDVTPFVEALTGIERVMLTPDRFRVSWGGFSQVRATLALLHRALAHPAHFGRFCLMSGADFPVASEAAIQAAFDSPVEYMRIDRTIGRESDPHSEYVRKYWFLDLPAPVSWWLSGKVPRRVPQHLTFYHGSQWWALTRPCVEYVVAFVNSHSEYRVFFKNVMCPDEIFFHSIVRNSTYAARVSDDFEHAADREAFHSSKRHGAHYIDWTQACGDSLPRVLTMSDFSSIVASGAFFARKFDEQLSSDLADAIAHRRR